MAIALSDALSHSLQRLLAVLQVSSFDTPSFLLLYLFDNFFISIINFIFCNLNDLTLIFFSIKGVNTAASLPAQITRVQHSLLSVVDGLSSQLSTIRTGLQEMSLQVKLLFILSLS